MNTTSTDILIYTTVCLVLTQMLLIIIAFILDISFDAPHFHYFTLTIGTVNYFHVQVIID